MQRHISLKGTGNFVELSRNEQDEDAQIYENGQPIAGNEAQETLNGFLAILAQQQYDDDFLSALEYCHELVSMYAFANTGFLVDQEALPILASIAFSRTSEYFTSRCLKIMSLLIQYQGDRMQQLIPGPEFVTEIVNLLDSPSKKIVLNGLKIIRAMMSCSKMTEIIIDMGFAPVMLRILTVHYLTGNIYRCMQSIIQIMAECKASVMVAELTAILTFIVEKVPRNKCEWLLYPLTHVCNCPDGALLVIDNEPLISYVSDALDVQACGSEIPESAGVAAFALGILMQNTKRLIPGFDYTKLLLMISAEGCGDIQAAALRAISSSMCTPEITVMYLTNKLVTHLLVYHEVSVFDVMKHSIAVMNRAVVTAPRECLPMMIRDGALQILIDSLSCDNAKVLRLALEALLILCDVEVVDDDEDLVTKEFRDRMNEDDIQMIMENEDSDIVEKGEMLLRKLAEKM